MKESVEADKQVSVYGPVAERLQQAALRGENPTMIFSDLDGTMDLPTPESTPTTNAARQLFEERGYVFVATTARSSEVLISESDRLKSPNFHRLPSHSATDTSTGKRYYEDPALVEPEGILNPPIIIGSAGTEIYVRLPQGGYIQDKEFARNMHESHEKWRASAMAILRAIDPAGTLITYSNDESLDNYFAGKSFISPPDFRIKMRFESNEKDNKQQANTFLQRLSLFQNIYPLFYKLRHQAKEGSLVALQQLQHVMHEFSQKGINVHDFPNIPTEDVANLKAIDDSNPKKEDYRFYVVPTNGSKAQAVDWVLTNVAKLLPHPSDDQVIQTYMLGDSFPDVGMGLYGAGRQKGKWHTTNHFLIPGGARITDMLMNDQSTIDYSLTERTAILRRLHRIDAGHATFTAPLADNPTQITIGDGVYPETKGPQTILQFFEDLK